MINQFPTILDMPEGQKGVSLVIVFFIMTIVIAMVLSITTILFNEIKLIGSIGNSVISFYSADSGIEKTLYFDRKKIPQGGTRGFCNICNICNNPNVDSHTYCNNCVAVPLGGNGCDVNSCDNCSITYSSSLFDSLKTYDVSATITPDNQSPTDVEIKINSRGYYQNITRQIELNGY